MTAIASANRLRPGPQILTPEKVRELFHPDWTARRSGLKGFAARYNLREGFDHTILWYRRHHWL